MRGRRAAEPRSAAHGTVGAHGHDARHTQRGSRAIGGGERLACQTHLVTLAHHRSVDVVAAGVFLAVKSQERLVELGDIGTVANVAKRGGGVAKEARLKLETETGKKVVSQQNAKQLQLQKKGS